MYVFYGAVSICENEVHFEEKKQFLFHLRRRRRKPTWTAELRSVRCDRRSTAEEGSSKDSVEDRKDGSGYYHKEHVDSHLGALLDVAPPAAPEGGRHGGRRREDPATQLPKGTRNAS